MVLCPLSLSSIWILACGKQAWGSLPGQSCRFTAELSALGCVWDSVALRLPSEISPPLPKSLVSFSGLSLASGSPGRKEEKNSSKNCPFLPPLAKLASSPERDSKKKRKKTHMVTWFPQAQWCLLNSLLLDYEGNDDRQIKRHHGNQNRAAHSLIRPRGDSASYCHWSASPYLTRGNRPSFVFTFWATLLPFSAIHHHHHHHQVLLFVFAILIV